MRASRPGLLRATGSVVRRSRRIVFCAAEMSDAGGALLATSRCTQVVLPDSGQFGRQVAVDRGGAPPEDARG